ncbi:MAG: serine/threonine protein kinase [Candidatus Brocadiia bacterium]
MFPFGKRSKSRFSGYFVNRLVHRGEKSLVFEGSGKKTARKVAIKLYTRAYDKAAARMERKYDIPPEKKVGLELNPAEREDSSEVPIAATIGGGREYDKRRGARYIVQEFVDGVSLKHLIACEDPLVAKNLGSFVFQCCRALRKVHKKGYVYRDFCTDNLLILRPDRLKLIDLGFVAPSGVAYEERSGTPTYMSPEQIQGKKLGPPTDIYSLGIVIYEMLTGSPPFVSDQIGENTTAVEKRSAQLMRQHLEKSVPPLPEETRQQNRILAGILPRCLAKNPAHRYDRIDELIGELVRSR